MKKGDTINILITKTHLTPFRRDVKIEKVGFREIDISYYFAGVKICQTYDKHFK